MAVQGLEAWSRNLRRVGKAAPDAARTALRAAAEDLVAQMQRAAPVETGALKLSIGWTFGAAPKGAMVVGQVRDPAARGGPFGNVVITIYAGAAQGVSAGRKAVADAFHARFQEFGTRNMPANPFFFPVYRANRAAIRSRVTRAVKKVLKNA